MLITTQLLCAHNACPDQVATFEEHYPSGLEPTLEHLMEAAALGLDVWWSYNLLPPEGPGSQRAYALWCVEQVQDLCKDSRVEECLAVVRRKVEDPSSVSKEELQAAQDATWAAWAAARAAQDAARAARAATWAAQDATWAAWAAARAAQDAVRAAAWAVRAAAWDAGDAAKDAAENSMRERQLACLADLLSQQE